MRNAAGVAGVVNIALILCCVRLVFMKYLQPEATQEPEAAQEPPAADTPAAGVAGGGSLYRGLDLQLAAVMHPNQEVAHLSLAHVKVQRHQHLLAIAQR